MKNISQFQIAYSLSKIIICVTIACSSTTGNITTGAYNFLTLFSTLFFAVALFLELKRQRYVTGLISVAGLIIFQPLMPVFAERGYEVNQNLLLGVFIVLFGWVAYDVWVMLIKIKKINSN